MPEATEETTDTTESQDEGLGEAGKKALEAERTRAKTAERSAREATAELERLKAQSMTDQEKAVATAKAEGRAEALATANDRLLRAELRAAAAGKLADPSDAVLVGDLSQFINDAGDVDDKAMSRAIDELVKAKPYLGTAARNVGSADGGSRPAPSNGGDMNALIRRVAGHA